MKTVKLYNIMFPIWFLLVFPMTWLAVLPINFAIDSAVLLVACAAMRLPDKKILYLRSIVKIWLCGFLADFAGAGLLIAVAFSGNLGLAWWDDAVVSPLMMNPSVSLPALLIALVAVGVSGLLIYALAMKIGLKRLELGMEKKRKIALSLAIATAPYLFLLPTTALYGWL